jgi:hypothetical protein
VFGAGLKGERPVASKALRIVVSLNEAYCYGLREAVMIGVGNR